MVRNYMSDKIQGIYYVLTCGQMGQLDTEQWLGVYGFVGVYDSVAKLKVDYDELDKKLEAAFQKSLDYIDSRSVFAKREHFDKLHIHIYDELSRSWKYNVMPTEVFKRKR